MNNEFWEGDQGRPLGILGVAVGVMILLCVSVFLLQVTPAVFANIQNKANHPTPTMTCIAGCPGTGPLAQLLGGPTPPSNYDPNASVRVFRDSATHSLCYQTFTSGLFSSGSSMTCVPEVEE